MTRKNSVDLLADAREFSNRYPSGTPMLYRSDPDAEPVGVHVKGAAFALSGHVSVAVTGVSGSVCIDSLEPIGKKNAEEFAQTVNRSAKPRPAAEVLRDLLAPATLAAEVVAGAARPDTSSRPVFTRRTRPISLSGRIFKAPAATRAAMQMASYNDVPVHAEGAPVAVEQLDGALLGVEAPVFVVVEAERNPRGYCVVLFVPSLEAGR